VERVIKIDPCSWMYPEQRAAIYDPARFSVIEAGTKCGKTVGCIAWLAERAALGSDGDEFWWVAPVFRQTRIAFRRMKRYLDKRLYTANNSDPSITLANGARIVFLSASNPDDLYGEDVRDVVIDEASRCKEESWVAIRSTLTATRGSCRIIGNVKGRKNWAFKLGKLARAGTPGYAYHRLSAYDAVKAGVLAVEEIEDARRVLPLDVYHELYFAVATEDGSNPFGIKAIRNCIAPIPKDPSPVVWGWDLARKHDWTVGVGLDARKRVAGFHRFQDSWPRTIERILEATGRCPAIVDGTGVGDPIVGDLEKATPREGQFESFIFTNRSKQQIMEGLAADVQCGEIYFPDNEIRREMDDFEYTHTQTGIRYEAPVGLHDDCVCSLALARRAYETRSWKKLQIL